MTDAAGEVAVSTHGVVRRFGATAAVQGIDFAVRRVSVAWMSRGSSRHSTSMASSQRGLNRSRPVLLGAGSSK